MIRGIPRLDQETGIDNLASALSSALAPYSQCQVLASPAEVLRGGIRQSDENCGSWGEEEEVSNLPTQRFWGTMWRFEGRRKFKPKSWRRKICGKTLHTPITSFFSFIFHANCEQQLFHDSDDEDGAGDLTLWGAERWQWMLPGALSHWLDPQNHDDAQID